VYIGSGETARCVS